MMNLFRKEERKSAHPDWSDPSNLSSAAVALDSRQKGTMGNDGRRENLVPPSRLSNTYDAAGVRSADWAVSLAAPTGVTDDRSDASPRTLDVESTIASQDSYVIDQNPAPLTTVLLRSPKHAGQTKIFTPPHGAPTPRSSNQRAKEASAYFIMDDKAAQKQFEPGNKRHRGPQSTENDGIFWLGPQGWWALAQNRLFGQPKPGQNAVSKDLEPTKTSSGRPNKIVTNTGDSLGHDPADISFLTRMGVFLCSSAVIYVILFVGMAAGLTYGTMNQLLFFSNINWDEQITVAFVGTSYLFVNDIPRLLEAMSGGQVIQDSCLRSGGSLATVLLAGNGMYYRWQTNEALINPNSQDDYYSALDDDASDSNNSHPLYDFGACSVHQLLAGYDNYLQYGNGNRAYSDDGNNPCLVDQNYYRYITTKYSSRNAPNWDFVILADQSKRMAASSSNARYDTIDALVSVYAPLLQQAGSVPVIVDTHAFWSSHSNMTGLDDVPTFARMIYQGVEEYISALAAELPTDQAPIVVPIGLAYLMIWEENNNMWQKLFLSDEMHSSLTGSYLFACVLYTKLFGHLPRRSASLPRRMEYLFAYSRRTIGADAVYPTTSEAEYLRGIAKRIVLDGELPKSFAYSYSDDGSSGGNR